MPAPAVGGSIESISIRGRLFPVASDAEATKKLGGFENEVQSNGDGGARLVKTRIPWGIDGVQVEISDARADAEFLQEIADGFDWVPITITLASGVTYQAKGTVSGEVGSSTQNATASITLSGPGTLTQQ
jgi:hypothetical protein